MNLFRKKITLLSGFVLLLTLGCQEKRAEDPSVKAASVEAPAKKAQAKKTKTVEIHSLDDLMALFDRLNYNSKSWAEGTREVPRLTFDRVRPSWQKTAQEIPVPLKKQVFFRLMTPLVLIANEKILADRQVVSERALADPQLMALAVRYKVVDEIASALTEQQRQELLSRVDMLPPSLVLVQAAEESGWASSRFTIEGNAFFGQWDFSGKGMVPKEQRKELGNYGLARFATPLASVESYMQNINTHPAYQKLRDLRASLRASNKLLTGMELAGTLDKYSERGQAYIEGLREMIRYNKLEHVDEAYLSEQPGLRLIGKG